MRGYDRRAAGGSGHGDLLLWGICIITSALAWVGQFWGRKMENKELSFLKDLQFLLIEPLWLLHFEYRRLGWEY